MLMNLWNLLSFFPPSLAFYIFPAGYLEQSHTFWIPAWGLGMNKAADTTGNKWTGMEGA